MGTSCGLLAALSVRVSVPVAAPSAVGVNVTLTLQVLPAVKVEPQVLAEMAKAPLGAMLLMVNATVPVFFKVTVLALLVSLTACLPKLREVGVKVTVVEAFPTV